MKRIFIILQILIPLISCEYSVSKSRAISEEIRETTSVIERHHYDSLTIPLFFSALCQNHLNDFYVKDSSSYIQFCFENNINQTDSSNISFFFTIKILHEIFTSNTAANCSKGEIINIPYQWHWVTPNPRYEIHFTHDNSLLKDTKPPKEFSKYRSFADIDRTPYLFISDLVSAEEKYYSSSCDTFSTFGWCSEREMAFIALIKLLEFEGKVVARGNHSWSELIISLLNKKT